MLCPTPPFYRKFVRNYGLSCRLWCVLHRVIHLFPHAWDVEWETGGDSVRAVDRGEPLQIVRATGTPRSLHPIEEMCGESAEEAMAYLYELEMVTVPR